MNFTIPKETHIKHLYYVKHFDLQSFIDHLIEMNVSCNICFYDYHTPATGNVQTKLRKLNDEENEIFANYSDMFTFYKDEYVYFICDNFKDSELSITKYPSDDENENYDCVITITRREYIHLNYLDDKKRIIFKL